MAAVILVSAAIPVLAHHSFAAEYDASQELKVTGTVTKFEWMNPHARFGRRKLSQGRFEDGQRADGHPE